MIEIEHVIGRSTFIVLVFNDVFVSYHVAHVIARQKLLFVAHSHYLELNQLLCLAEKKTGLLENLKFQI